MNPICLYHRDADGCCAAAVVVRALGDVDVRSMQYGDVVPWDLLEGRDVIVVDFSLQPWDQMDRLFEVAKMVTWIDHHKTAIADFKAWFTRACGAQFEQCPSPPTRFEGRKFSALLEDGTAGCELAWKYYFPNKHMPEIVHHIGRYDVWDHSEATTKHVAKGMRARELDPKLPYWKDLLDEDTESFLDLVDAGLVIGSYEKKHYERACKAVNILETDHLTGKPLRLATLNTIGNGEALDSVDPMTYDVGILFSWSGQHWRVSLFRSSATDADLDVATIARKYGGGGHAGAAGFQVDVLPYWVLGKA